MAGSTAILAVRIIGDAKDAVKEFGKAEAAGGKFARGMEKLTGPATAGGLAAGAALTKGLFDAVDADSANRKLAGQMGLTGADAQAAGKMAGEMYSNAYGGSLEEVNTAIGAVGSTLADISTNGGADVQRLSEKALDLAGTFDTDVTEAVNTAGILMKTGLAKDGDQAMDLLVASMQKVPASMRGELLPVMDEYATNFAALGIDGTTAFGIISNAAQDGAIGMDKTGDALKELTIRATDGSTATADAMKTIGLDAGKMATDVAKGGTDAAGAFADIVHGLQGIEDPAEQAQAAIALFGTPLEDLGVSKIPQFLGQIDPAGDAFDDVAGAADRLSETVNSGPGVALTEFSRTAQASLQEIAANAIPYIQPVLDILMQFAPILGPVAVAVAAFAATVWLVNAAMGAWTAIMAVSRGIMAVATAAQWAWNAAMAANPIGVIILLIAGLVAGLVWAYQNIGWVRDAFDFLGSVAVAVWEWIVAGVQNAITWLDGVLAPVGGIEGAMALMGEAAAVIWEGFIGWIEDGIGWLDSMLEPIGGIDGAIAGLGAAADIAFGMINDAISGTIGWVKDAIGWFQSLFGAKNDAAAAGGGSGAPAPTSPSTLMSAPVGIMAAPLGVMSTTTTAQPLMTAYSAPSASGLSSAIGSLSSGGIRAGDEINIDVTVKADATTDKAALGAALLDSINRALMVRGKPRLA